MDILAAAPLISATLARRRPRHGGEERHALLDDFCAAGIAVEVTHRSKRRLFGLAGLAPLRDEVRPPHRPEPGRGRGRPPLVADGCDHRAALPPVLRSIASRSITATSPTG